MAKVLDSELSVDEKALIQVLDDHVDYFKLVKKTLPPEIALTAKQWKLLLKIQERAKRHRHETYAANLREIQGKGMEYRGVPLYEVVPQRRNYRRKDTGAMF